MTHSCPLPVDWFDYLDGNGDPSLAEHVTTCRSCQALVASLKAAHTEAPLSQSWTADIIGRTDAVWRDAHQPTPEPPSPAEFWFSASDYDFGGRYIAEAKTTLPRFGYTNVDRVLVLVVSHPETDHFGWTDVVPVLSDVESAAETDLLFSAEENSLGSPWRALFAHQSKVARDQLATRVGTLTDVGFSVLTAALAGDFDDARWGIPLQGPFDPRARLDEGFTEGLKRLRTPWLLLQDAEPDSDADSAKMRVFVSHAAQPEQPDERPGLFWLTPRFDAQHEHALAAASSAAKAKWWVVDQHQFKLQGRLDVEWGKGLLVFVITTAELHSATRLRLWLVATNGDKFASDPFAPVEGDKVALGRELTDADVDQLGAEMVP